MDFREDRLMKTSTNRLGRSTNLAGDRTHAVRAAPLHNSLGRKLKTLPPVKINSRTKRSGDGFRPIAEVGERLRIILRLARPTKVPQRIRHLLNRLAKLDHEIENKTSPSIVPSANEGVRRLLASRFR
jgi:hypothetical protein